ncbi:ExeM/NucH family extracellular endonuclease [Lysobacter sp. BMK333-48F3]|uniref:ExeM/NucH family extracellular endonuclease n=1 Tax=Lysobacter sp. BMK333-48F3 TaxID=2867962 RepID=UPI001C8B2518|nr:ExeM/NucH family extracellular endonuclease [Lysobacter sp. BMK333-48F3]MBX9400935.1 ExeM/NucH family extracellular endonuclease [Lysobacter sp. BMK333-48F3]
MLRSRSVCALAPCLLLAACAGAPSRTPSAQPGPGAIAIGTIQGRATASAWAGREAIVEGRINAALAGTDGAPGWLLQDGGDGDEASSDAIWITGRAVAALAPGQSLRVHGRVFETPRGHGSTLTALAVQRVEPLPARASKALARLAPVAIAQAPDWNRLEGMRVRIAAPLTLAEGDRKRGALQVSFDGPLWQPTERAEPGSEAARAVAADNARRRLWLRGDEAALGAAAFAARSGSRLDGAQGVVVPGEDGATLQLDAAPTLQAAPRPAPPQVAGELRIAAFNLENLFNGDGRGGGFPTPRGARTLAEYQAQLDKLVATIHALDPDVAALMELENDGYGPESTLAALVAALDRADAAVGGAQDWRFAAPCKQPCAPSQRGPGDNPIRVGLIYRGQRVAAQGVAATLQQDPFGPLARVPMAQAFRALGPGGARGPAFVVAANHFKSKGCSNATGADRDQGDGASCWNASRVDAARRLDAWLQRDPTASGGDLNLIVGDLNAHAQEAPLRTLYAAGWRDAFAVAGVEAPYSYVYRGELGRLDHALLSPALAQRLRGAAEWHVNAAEPDQAGYRDGGTGPWRSSDHDPMLLGFDLQAR